MTEQVPDTLIDDLASSEPLQSPDIPQFDASNAFTEDEKKRIAQVAQSELQLDAHAGFDTANAKEIKNLLAIAPETIASLTLDSHFLWKLSDIVAGDNATSAVPFIADWTYLCRMINPEKVSKNIDTNYMESSLRDEINANNPTREFNFYSVFTRLADLTTLAPQKAKIYATEELWEKIKVKMENFVAQPNESGILRLRDLRTWIPKLQLAFPGRIRELSFFQTWHQQLMHKYERDYEEQKTISPHLLYYAATDAYDLALLTSDGMEVTEDGQLRIIPHQSANPHSIPEPPQEYV